MTVPLRVPVLLRLAGLRLTLQGRVVLGRRFALTRNRQCLEVTTTRATKMPPASAIRL